MELVIGGSWRPPLPEVLVSQWTSAQPHFGREDRRKGIWTRFAFTFVFKFEKNPTICLLCVPIYTAQLKK